MNETFVTDKGGKTLMVTDLNGHLYPRSTKEALENCTNFQARSDDILLCTYPKSGTHWAWEIIRLLIAGTADLPLKEKDDNHIEFASPSEMEQLSSPRNLNTHYHYDALSQDFFTKRAKIIYITRDPRDVAASYFHHHKKLTKWYQYDGEWKDYFYLYLEGEVDYDSWFDYTKSWEKAMKENPDHPFLVLSYEAMKKNAFKAVKLINEFLGFKHTDEFLKVVVEKSSFDSMKNQRQPTESKEKMVMYRKGTTGDWKNYFTVAQSELFNEKFEKEMAGTDAYQLYSHTLHAQSDPNMNSV